MASTDAYPLPRKNVAFRASFPMMLNTGALISNASGLAATISKDQGADAASSNTPTQTASGSKKYYLDLTATEMNADTVHVNISSTTTDAVETVLVFNPQEAGDIKVDVQTVATQTASAAGAVTFPGTIASTTNITSASGITVSSNGDKTGYSLASGGLVAVTTWNVAIAGNITGNLTGSVGSVSGNVGGNVNGNVAGSVASVTGSVGSVTGNVGGSVASVTAMVTANTIQVGGTVQTARDLGLALPAVAPGASGGLLRSGSNTGTTTFSNFGVSGAFVINSLDVSTILNAIYANVDVATSTRMASYTQPSGFLLATFPSTIASTTNITAGTITTVSGNVNGSVNSVTSAVTVPTDVGNAATRFLTMIQLDGGVYQLTANALELAPSSGGGGSSDWTADERATFKAIIGVPNSGTTPVTPSTGVLAAIIAKTSLIPASPAASGDIPSAATIASTVNTVLTASHGVGSWQQGSGTGLTGPIAVTLIFKDSKGAVVPFVDFSVEGVGPGRTAGDGSLSFGLVSGVYNIAARPTNGVVFPVVSLDATFATALVITGQSPATVNLPIVIPPANGQTSWG